MEEGSFFSLPGTVSALPGFVLNVKLRTRVYKQLVEGVTLFSLRDMVCRWNPFLWDLAHGVLLKLLLFIIFKREREKESSIESKQVVYSLRFYLGTSSGNTILYSALSHINKVIVTISMNCLI